MPAIAFVWTERGDDTRQSPLFTPTYGYAPRIHALAHVLIELTCGHTLGLLMAVVGGGGWVAARSWADWMSA
jgi:hypothetical protein